MNFINNNFYSVLKVSNVPACRLIGPSKYDIIEENDKSEPILCYGDCDGCISIYSMKTLKLVRFFLILYSNN